MAYLRICQTLTPSLKPLVSNKGWYYSMPASRHVCLGWSLRIHRHLEEDILHLRRDEDALHLCWKEDACCFRWEKDTCTSTVQPHGFWQSDRWMATECPHTPPPQIDGCILLPSYPTGVVRERKLGQSFLPSPHRAPSVGRTKRKFFGGPTDCDPTRG